MALVLPNSIFFHVPKTGGTFVRKTIWDLGIPHEEVGPPHGSPMEFSRSHPDLLEEKFVFVFLRHPVGWWQSYWAHRIIHGWSWEHPMDRACNDTDFNRYMEKILSCEWKRHYLDIYRSFVTDRTDFVGRQETLVNDLRIALKQAGEKFDDKSLGRIGYKNTSPSMKAGCSRRTRRSIVALHKDIILDFYRDKNPLFRWLSLFRGA